MSSLLWLLMCYKGPMYVRSKQVGCIHWRCVSGMIPGLRGEHCHSISTVCTESATWTPNNNTAACTRGSNMQGWRAKSLSPALPGSSFRVEWKQSHRQSWAYGPLLSLLLSPADAPTETRPTARSTQKHHHIHTTAKISQPLMWPHCAAQPHPAFLLTRICK